jgi:hypothetical protein
MTGKTNYEPGSKRYPTQGSVSRYFGEEGSLSIFLRNWPMKTRKYSGCSVLFGPQIAAKQRSVRHHFAGTPRQIHQQIEFFWV